MFKPVTVSLAVVCGLAASPAAASASPLTSFLDPTLAPFDSARPFLRPGDVSFRAFDGAPAVGTVIDSDDQFEDISEELFDDIEFEDDECDGDEFDEDDLLADGVFTFVGGDIGELNLAGNAFVRILGGSFDDISLTDNAVVEIVGGHFDDADLNVYGDGLAIIYGLTEAFVVEDDDDNLISAGELRGFGAADDLDEEGDFDDGIDEIRGTFLDGTDFEFDDVEICGNGHVLLIPEPGTLTLACVAGAAAAGLRRRRLG